MAEHNRPQVDADLACACGAVRIRVTGTPRAMLMCACEDCQKATGSGHSALAIFDGADVAVTGETRSFDRPAASGATFTRTFCPACGTQIHGRSSRWTDARMLPIGLFGGDATWFRPNQLIFSRTHRDWDIIADDLPRHATYRQKEG